MKGIMVITRILYTSTTFLFCGFHRQKTDLAPFVSNVPLGCILGPKFEIFNIKVVGTIEHIHGHVWVLTIGVLLVNPELDSVWDGL